MSVFTLSIAQSLYVLLLDLEQKTTDEQEHFSSFGSLFLGTYKNCKLKAHGSVSRSKSYAGGKTWVVVTLTV